MYQHLSGQKAELRCDVDFEMWTPEYGWWLDKRKNNLADIRRHQKIS